MKPRIPTPAEVRETAYAWRRKRRREDPAIVMGLAGGVSIDDQDAQTAMNSGGSDTGGGGAPRRYTAAVTYES